MKNKIIIKNPSFLIAKKEIMDNIRNFWIILVTAIFVILTLIESYFGSMLSTGWHGLDETILFMKISVEVIVPILTLMLGYSAIVGEIESGSMSALLSMPLHRREVIIGKFLGLGGVLSLSLLLGFGVAGAVIGTMVPDAKYGEYVFFILSTILYGLAYLSVALFFSTLFRKRSTAMGGAIFLWFFFSMIMPMVLIGIAVAGNFLSGDTPAWYHALNLINPTTVFSVLVSLNINSNYAEIQTYPSFYTTELMVAVFTIWILAFLTLTMLRFLRKDI